MPRDQVTETCHSIAVHIALDHRSARNSPEEQIALAAEEELSARNVKGLIACRRDFRVEGEKVDLAASQTIDQLVVAQTTVHPVVTASAVQVVVAVVPVKLVTARATVDPARIVTTLNSVVARAAPYSIATTTTFHPVIANATSDPVPQRKSVHGIGSRSRHPPPMRCPDGGCIRSGCKT